MNVLSNAERWTVVLDDDPTGTQGLHDVRVVIDAASDTLAWASENQSPTYVFTNTRALDEDGATAVIARAVRVATKTADERGWRIRWISRGDSTLRGHFPLELETIRRTLPQSDQYRGILLVPSFPAAGRVTLDGVHYVGLGTELIPVGESEFAKDATFGYSHSRLSDWARERIPPSWGVQELPSTLFDLGLSALVETLVAVSSFTVVCPSIRHEQDLALLADAHREAELRGTEFLTQAGPAYARHLSSLTPATHEHKVSERDHGLVVVGSHTAITNAQLARAEKSRALVHVEVDAAAAIGPDAHQEIERCVNETSQGLTNASVVLSTSRVVLRDSDRASSLRTAQIIGAALIEIARRAIETSHPTFVIGKGGITSHDLIEHSLGWRACKVLGPLVDQTLPVIAPWPVQQSGSSPICVVFPGNVGGPELLRTALERLGVPVHPPIKAASR